MSAGTVTPDAPRGKRTLGIYALFDCDRRPSQAFIRACHAARRYPFEIAKPKRVLEAEKAERRGP